MRKFRIPYIPYRSLLLSTTVLNDIRAQMNSIILIFQYSLIFKQIVRIKTHDSESRGQEEAAVRNE